jgi:hypothetical protein
MLTEIHLFNVCLADANTSPFQRCGEWSNTVAARVRCTVIIAFVRSHGYFRDNAGPVPAA